MVTAHPSVFGSLLKRYRIAAGLTQEELAERARLSARAVSDLERGVRRSPYRDTVQQLADALDLPAEERRQLEQAARTARGLSPTEDTPPGERASSHAAPATASSSHRATTSQQMTDRADYGIITALTDEMTAVLQALEGYEEVARGRADLRYYYRSVLRTADGSDQVVVAVCTNGMGQQAALNATRDLLAAWHPRHVLLVGIAGGIEARGVRQGDVLVPRYVHYYEPGKITPNGTRYRTRSFEPSLPLQTAADALTVELATRGAAASWVGHLVTSRPGGSCTLPQVHREELATGEQVWADLGAAVVREVLAQHEKVVGIENEAAGVFNAVREAPEQADVLVIKGVSDLVANKDDTWRQYAAGAAAAFARGLIDLVGGRWQRAAEGILHTAEPDDPRTSTIPLDHLPGETSTSAHNLPEQPTSFIGREQEVTEICHLLEEEGVRLVTLTGPGGTGKTRLALQVGSALLHAFADGVFFVNLSSLTDAALVSSAVAAVLEVKEEGGKDLLERLAEYLKDKHLLLVLDNYEHLLESSAVVSTLLDRCRELHVLVTSRIPMHLAREHEYAVPPLAVPDPMQLPDLEFLSQYEAVALFIDRSRAVKADFRVTNDNAPAVAEICARLDGLPLAIELAAARIKVFPPQALLQRLSNRLRLLTGGARDRPPRQQTLRNTIAWSYALLAADEQILFARLSVFAGGCTFAAAEAVCNSEGDLDLLEGISSLVDKSLLRQEGAEEPRFIMLETIREYAAERLDAIGAADEMKGEHCRHYVVLAEEAALSIDGANQAVWLERLEVEHDNMRAALQWARDQGDLDRGLRLALALSEFWMARGPISEGRQWLEDLVAAEGGSPVFRAAALSAAGKLAGVEGRHREAAERFEQSLMLSRDLGDRKGVAEATGFLAVAWQLAGEQERIDDLLRESEIQARATGDKELLAMALRLQTLTVAMHGDAQTARRLGEESLALYRELGNNKRIADLLQILTYAAYSAGEVGRARMLIDEMLPLLRQSHLDAESAQWITFTAVKARGLADYAYATYLMEDLLARAGGVGDRRAAALARRALGLLAREQGRYQQATRFFQESIADARQGQDPYGVGCGLLGLSDVARDQGDAERVIELCEESLVLLREVGVLIEVGYALHNLGLAAWYARDHARAERLFAESLALFQRSGVPDGTIEVMLSAGLLALDQGRHDRAGEILTDCLEILRKFGLHWMMATLLEGMAGVAIGQGHAERAGRLLGAAEALRRAAGTPRWPAHQNLYNRSVDATRTALGEECFCEIQEQGLAMPLEEAISYAQHETLGDRGVFDQADRSLMPPALGSFPPS